MPVIPRKTGVRRRYAAIVNHPAVLRILRVVNLLRVLFFVWRGPLGILSCYLASHWRIGALPMFQRIARQLGDTPPIKTNMN